MEWFFIVIGGITVIFLTSLFTAAIAGKAVLKVHLKIMADVCDELSKEEMQQFFEAMKKK